jgi:hypothetical protein
VSATSGAAQRNRKSGKEKRKKDKMKKGFIVAKVAYFYKKQQGSYGCFADETRSIFKNHGFNAKCLYGWVRSWAGPVKSGPKAG